jgi:hypothetical protein
MKAITSSISGVLSQTNMLGQALFLTRILDSIIVRLGVEASNK